MTSIRRQTVFAGLDQPPAWPRTPRAPWPERLERGLETLPGVGTALTKRLAKLGLETVGDVLEHAPFRFVEPATVAELLPDGEEAAIDVEVLSASKRRARRLTLVEARVRDRSGQIRATWFNQPWVADQLQPGRSVRLVGTLRRGGFAVRSHELDPAPAPRVPVYPAGEEISPKTVRRLVAHALPHVADVFDPLPAELRERERLPLRRDALRALHEPADDATAERARERLAFEELLVLQVGIARRAAERERTLAPSLGEPGELIERYRKALPFALTPYQEQAVRELDDDLGRTVPMQRLLQGDVGSGKTVVALYALLRAVEHGRQGALMAPTETLAEQHFLTVEPLCTQLGVTCALLTSTSRKRDRDLALHADVVVGTHALIQAGVELRDLAVAVVDEQHRFGVEQRKALGHGRAPHVLHMTATPIPRTLALTVYGDLAVSEIAKPPASRKPIVTSWITEERAHDAYVRLTRLLREGRQAYVVCPLVEASETTLARAAEEEAERLRGSELREFRVGCLHGRLRPDERRDVMARFKARELDVLVATTVIEVGVDVPNATVMIVQEADRFGLAQLHQLRGRVGRGGEQSYCLLVSRAKEELTETAAQRLEALVRTTDGFELAEVDFELRGGGQLFGTRQHGLSDLRFARLREDRPLLERARAVVRDGLELDVPELELDA
ncbi:MAG TPA: ATP-dependent DNA helicase RecG [Gaiellaceae bacterium]|nr:ATP-dependent DNA helicase RecG [Gaiellaceae bacterium]